MKDALPSNVSYVSAPPLREPALPGTGRPSLNRENDRESPSLEVLELLKEKGAEVSYHDPFVGEAVIGGESLRSVPLSDEVIGDQDLVAILTAHPSIDHRRIVDLASLVFDARGVTKPMQRTNLVRL